MSNPFQELMNEVGEETPKAISDNKDVADGLGGSFTVEDEGNAPIEVSQQEIQAMLDDLDDTATAILWENTDKCRLLKLLAKSPNVSRWVTEQMGITELECVKGVKAYIGRKLPVKMPKNPSQTIDGYLIDRGEGTEAFPLSKSEAVEWLINNTVGRIVGGDEGKELHVVESNSKSLSSKKLPVKVVHYGLTSYSKDDVIDTFEQDYEADGTPKTARRTVTLDAGEQVVGADNKRVTLRGEVENYPVFRRKEEYISALGVLNSRSLRRGPVKGEKDRKDVLKTYAELLAKYKKSKGQVI